MSLRAKAGGREPLSRDGGEVATNSCLTVNTARPGPRARLTSPTYVSKDQRQCGPLINPLLLVPVYDQR